MGTRGRFSGLFVASRGCRGAILVAEMDGYTNQFILGASMIGVVVKLGVIFELVASVFPCASMRVSVSDCVDSCICMGV
jgi:hypothetical protein